MKAGELMWVKLMHVKLVQLTIARLPEQSLLGMTMSPRGAGPRGSPRAAISLSLHGSPVGSPVGSPLAAWKRCGLTSEIETLHSSALASSSVKFKFRRTTVPRRGRLAAD